MQDLRRLEELGLNSSAPPGQLLYDGWLLRMLPGSAKRARSVNAVYPSTLPVMEKIAHCRHLYRAAGLPPIFRITPFSTPVQLDTVLADSGYRKFEITAVESTMIDPSLALPTPHVELTPLPEWVAAVAALRGSPADHRDAHLARLLATPLSMRAFTIRDEGAVVATGLTIVEDRHAGLFDIVTHPAARRRGHAVNIVAALLKAAWDLGARHAYLQTKADNAPARTLYRRFGFEERYCYWYRGREGEQR